MILQCKNDPLHVISKSNQEDRVEALTLIFLTNLDIDTYACDAVFCGNAYFYRNSTIKMAKFDHILPNLLFFYATPT